MLSTTQHILNPANTSSLHQRSKLTDCSIKGVRKETYRSIKALHKEGITRHNFPQSRRPDAQLQRCRRPAAATLTTSDV
jgi:hypothetical protein